MKKPAPKTSFGVVDGGGVRAARMPVEQTPEPKEKPALKRRHSVMRELWVVALLAIGFGAGWMSYDLTVKNTAAMLQEQTIKGAIARQIAEEAVR